jgi:hypothetical protein
MLPDLDDVADDVLRQSADRAGLLGEELQTAHKLIRNICLVAVVL